LDAQDPVSRRQLLQRIALAASIGTLTTAQLRAAESPLISEDDPEAKAVKYVEDATRAKEAKKNTCATCASYTGLDGTARGGCRIFKDKDVKAAGWCKSWTPQM